MQWKHRSAIGWTFVLIAMSLLGAACTSVTTTPGGESPSGGSSPSEAAKRNKIYQDIQRYAYTDDSPILTLGYERTYYMWWNHVKGYKVLGGPYEGLRHDAVWLDK